MNITASEEREVRKGGNFETRKSVHARVKLGVSLDLYGSGG